ncbi:hypothetical protein KCP74_03310 [Salmonella enterica subsp. enterica]|nr:hypothetical protein KCP74_03310 [Salmonella enterica subsp. enterica]
MPQLWIWRFCRWRVVNTLSCVVNDYADRKFDGRVNVRSAGLYQRRRATCCGAGAAGVSVGADAERHMTLFCFSVAALWRWHRFCSRMKRYYTCRGSCWGRFRLVNPHGVRRGERITAPLEAAG